MMTRPSHYCYTDQHIPGHVEACVEHLRAEMCAWLAKQRVGVLSAVGQDGVWSLPVSCRATGLTVLCLIPHWADALFYLEQCPQAQLLFVEGDEPGQLQWLLLSGEAALVPESPPDHGVLCQTVRLVPRRAEWVDEAQGWGVRRTLDL